MILSAIGMEFMAVYGLSSIFYYAIAAIAFFIPTGVASIQLSKNYGYGQGLYTWIEKSLGRKTAFLAVWTQWASVIVFYPTILAFLSGILLYMINPELINNPHVMFWVTLFLGWATIAGNFFGTETSVKISTTGGVLAALMPAFLAAIMAVIWLYLGKSKMVFSASSFLPQAWSFGDVSLLVSTVVAFAGIEYSSYFANEIINSKKNYTKSIFIAIILIVVVVIIGTLGISIITYGQKVSLISGFMQAFTLFFNAFNIPLVASIVGIVFSLGFICVISTLMLSVAKGALILAENKHIPHNWGLLNRFGAPYRIIIGQGFVMTVLCGLYVWLPQVNDAYWIVGVLSSILVGVKYLLIFIASLKTELCKINGQDRADFKKYRGIRILFFLLGALSCSAVIVLAFFPPNQIGKMSMLEYDLILGLVIIIVLSAPFFCNYGMLPKNTS